jgi:hypothetical protein
VEHAGSEVIEMGDKNPKKKEKKKAVVEKKPATASQAPKK